MNMLIEEDYQNYTIDQLQQTALDYLLSAQYDKSILIYEKCIELEPNIISNYWYLGLNLLIIGEKLEAETIWFSAIAQLGEEESTYVNDLLQALLLASNTFLQRGNLPTAQKIYEQILEIEPNCIIASTSICQIYLYENRLNEAIEYFQKISKKHPDCPGFYKELGILYFKIDSLDNAITYFSKALEIAADFIDAKSYLNHVKDIVKGRNAGYAPPKLGLENRVWDPFIFKEKKIYRLFYLTSEITTNYFWINGALASATSSDMETWDYLGIVHHSNPNVKWESGRILAGSVYQENCIYYLFYPASPPGEELLDEKIGLATSIDGKEWQRRKDFLMSPHSDFYTYSHHNFKSNPYEEFKIYKHWQWRDPYIIKEEVSGKYYMFITAASVNGTRDFGGCIACAVANQIDGDYEILPPAALPILENTQESIFYEMERPQIIYRYNKYHLFFSSPIYRINPKWLEIVGKDKITSSSLYWYTSKEITGPFKPATDKPVVENSDKTGLYGINFIEDPNGNLVAYGWYFNHTLEVSSRFPVYWDETSVRILLD